MTVPHEPIHMNDTVSNDTITFYVHRKKSLIDDVFYPTLDNQILTSQHGPVKMSSNIHLLRKTTT